LWVYIYFSHATNEKCFKEFNINVSGILWFYQLGIKKKQVSGSGYVQILEKIRYRIIIPEFYVTQICKHGRSVVIG
jgi:hypothetical protein